MTFTITRWLKQAGEHSTLLHNHIFQELMLTFVQMDKFFRRAPHTGKMWLWCEDYLVGNMWKFKFTYALNLVSMKLEKD